MSSKLNILFLSSWFPSKYIPTIGNFVKAHAKAIARYHNVDVIYATKVQDLDSVFVSENIKEGNLNIFLMYFREAKTGVPLLNQLVNTSRYFRAYKKLFRQLENTPDLVHANVVWPIGLFALYLKKRYGIKYILTEHWSALKQKDNFTLFRQKLIRLVFKNTENILPVSEDLKSVIEQWGSSLPLKVIPNPVNTQLFYYQEKKKNKIFNWIHVSTLDPVKNVEGIIRTFSNLLKEDKYNHLTIISDGDLKSLEILIKAIRIPEQNIKLIGISTNAEVAELLKISDAYLQFSRSETFGIVAAEALCCGKPLVSTQVGFLKEFEEQQVGLFVKNEDENDLLNKMKVSKTLEFDGNKCSRCFSKQFNFSRISSMYSNVYNSVLNNS